MIENKEGSSLKWRKYPFNNVKNNNKGTRLIWSSPDTTFQFSKLFIHLCFLFFWIREQTSIHWVEMLTAGKRQCPELNKCLPHEKQEHVVEAAAFPGRKLKLQTFSVLHLDTVLRRWISNLSLKYYVKAPITDAKLWAKGYFSQIILFNLNMHVFE